MITNRDDLLSAVRRADLTPQGLQVGPVAFVDGKDILFGKVTTEEMRKQLIMKIKLASSTYFAANVLWLLPGVKQCSEKIPF